MVDVRAAAPRSARSLGGAPIRGRDADLAAVLERLGGPQRVVTIAGRGGVGKTRLAEEVAVAHAHLDSVRVTMTSFTALHDPGLVVPHLAEALGVPASPDVDALDALVRALDGDAHLVVLDGFEHLLGAASALGTIVEQCPHVRILVTSQAPLGLRAEAVVHLEPLELPPADADPAAIAATPAVQLYCDRAVTVQRAFTLDERDAPAVAALCRRLEGLPLAIELAAARAAVFPAGEILARLDEQPLDVLRVPRRDVPERHHDLRSAIAWTYGLLDEGQQHLFRHLAVTTDGFAVDVAAAVDGDSPANTMDRLEVLVGLRLVERSGEEAGAFAMPWSIRVFAREQLDGAEETEPARRALVAWSAERAREIVTRPDGDAAERWGVATPPEVLQLTHALTEAIALRAAGDALALVVGLAPHWRLRGCGEVQLGLVGAALDLATEDEPTSVRADALAWATLLDLARLAPGAAAGAGARLDRVTDLARTSGADGSLLLALSVAALAAQFTADFVRARAAVDEASELLDRRPHERWRARFDVWSGMLAHVTGDVDRAVALGIAGLTVATRTRDSRTVLAGVMLVRSLAATRPDLLDLLPSVEATMALARDEGYVVFEAMLGPFAAAEAAADGRGDDAIELALESLVLARSLPGVAPGTGALLAAVVALVAGGEHRAAVRTQGVVEASMPLLEAAMTPAQRELHVRSMADARARLGTATFERELRRGALLSVAEGVQQTIELLRALLIERRDASTRASVHLTPRQRDILRLLGRGLTNKEIAARLGIRPKTVMHHMTTTFKAIGVRTRTEAALWAAANGLDEQGVGDRD